MNFATEAYVRSALASSREELGDKMRMAEVRQGFSIVTEARWFNRDEWTPYTIVSQDKTRVRMVALEAKAPGNGAFTRLISGIWKSGLVPVLVEPNQTLVDWCHRHQFRKRTIGNKEYRHDIWYPRRCAY
jgi:hypothetical protein